jgi:chromosome segregation ATPase
LAGCAAGRPRPLLRLGIENAELKARVAELEQGLAPRESEEGWTERQREYEALLEEKSEVIRTLHLKIQELQELQESARRAPDEPLPPEEVLYQLKKELDEQRRQLQEDEESVMAQMRQMELSLSRDRAELARQRQEVQRIQADLNRELEQASRDPELRERLNSLRRPHEPAKREPAVNGPAEPARVAKQSSGIFKRLFG